MIETGYEDTRYVKGGTRPKKGEEKELFIIPRTTMDPSLCSDNTQYPFRIFRLVTLLYLPLVG